MGRKYSLELSGTGPQTQSLFLRAFSALCSSVFLFPTFWPSPGSVQVMATLQKFIANYGHINQNGLRGLSPSSGEGEGLGTPQHSRSRPKGRSPQRSDLLGQEALREAFSLFPEGFLGRLAEGRGAEAHRLRGCKGAVKSGSELGVAVAPGALVMLMFGGPWPEHQSPAPLGSVIRHGGRFSAWPALIYTSPARPLSLFF